jgi:hypothetical protein
MVTLCYIRNNSTELLEEKWNPPHKCRGVKKAICSSIIRNFNRVAFLEIHLVLPAYSPIFPFNTQVPTLGFFPHLSVASMLDVHISRFNGMSISIVVNNALHLLILSAFYVTLGIHILCNYIYGIFVTAAVIKINFISPGVQHLVGIGSPPHSVIQLMLAPDYLNRADLTPNGYPNMGSNILVICINIILLFNIINVRHI